MGRLKLPKTLFRLYPSFNGPVILFQHVVRILHRPVPAPSPQDPSLFQCRNRRLVDRSLVGVDDTGLGMREIAQRYTEQLLSSRRIAKCRQHEVDRGAVESIARYGYVATIKKLQERDWSSRPGFVSCRHFEQLVDELYLSPNIRTAHPVWCD